MLNLNQPLEKIAADLIAIPSESGNEKEICREITSCLSEKFLIQGRGENLVVRLNNFEGAANIALVGHIDTVPASSDSQLIPKFENGNLIGRGAVDMKAGLACMLKIAYEISQGTLKPKKNLKLVFYSGEEAPLPNGLNYLKDGKLLDNIDFSLVLEPTDGRYCVGCLGSLTAKVEVKGKSAHSASPHLGVNAIYKSSPLIERVSAVPARDFVVGQYSGREVMNVTTINTKNAHNTIPGSCEIAINYRFAPGKTLEQAELEMRLVAGEEIQVIDASQSCLASSKIDRFLLPGIKKQLLTGWSDIAQLNDWAIPSINYGPGSLVSAHSADEHISVRELNGFYNQLVKHL
ncbi:MAG: M20/M25/M40 family metallo-hydrolase [Nanoarchaeota archaeon]